MNASALRKERVWGERKDDVTSMHELTYICKQNLLIVFPHSGYPADNSVFFTLLESESSLKNGLRRRMYFTCKATLHCQP